MMHAKAHAKINLGLVVGALREDGKHEVVTLLQRIALQDDVSLESATEIDVQGFSEDTIARAALAALAASAGHGGGWHVRIEKRIPVAAGLGGGSADAATALALANATLDEPLGAGELHALAASIGADVPFFLREGAQLASGDGTTLEPIFVPRDYTVVLVVPDDVTKQSTRAVYEAFDRRDGAQGFETRAAQVATPIAAIAWAEDLAALPPNDLGTSPIAKDLAALGAFRADVSGAGPTVYGLFRDPTAASAAEQALRSAGRTYLSHPV
jgi:4-diphosphocytidyl-2-C-methyl-D-erythritol kinase